MAEFHEAFWVAVATVGSVIALAHAVTIERAFRRGLGRPSGYKFNLRRWVRTGDRNQNTKEPKYPQFVPSGWAKVRWLAANALLLTPPLTAGVGFAASLAATQSAITRLGYEHDLDMTSAVVQIGLALWMLLASSLLTPMISGMFSFPDRPMPARPQWTPQEDDVTPDP